MVERKKYIKFFALVKYKATVRIQKNRKSEKNLIKSGNVGSTNR